MKSWLAHIVRRAGQQGAVDNVQAEITVSRKQLEHIDVVARRLRHAAARRDRRAAESPERDEQIA